MTAPIHDFTGDYAFEQGATLNRRLIWKDSNGVVINLTGYTARMQVRQSVSSAVKLMDLTTENGGIVLGGSAGTVDIKATAAAMAAMTWKRGVYDIELISADGTVTRLLSGDVELVPEVTR
jgi:hypothetical protein